MNNKFEDLLNSMKLNDLLCKKEVAVEKKKNKTLMVVAGISILAAIAAVAFAIYKHCSKKTYDDYEDDYEDAFEDLIDDYEDELDETEESEDDSEEDTNETTEEQVEASTEESEN